MKTSVLPLMYFSLLTNYWNYVGFHETFTLLYQLRKKKKKKKIYKKNKILELLLDDTLLKMLNFQAHLYW